MIDITKVLPGMTVKLGSLSSGRKWSGADVGDGLAPYQMESLPVHEHMPSGDKFPILFMKPVDGVMADVFDRSVAQLKADGVGGGYLRNRVYSREAITIDAAGHCIAGLQRLERAYGCRMVFQGEYCVDMDYAATLSAYKSGVAGRGVFWVYDAIPYDQWLLGCYESSLEARRIQLGRNFPAAQSSFVGLLHSFTVHPGHHKNVLKQIYAAGLEGLVFKRLNSVWIRARASEWRRFKETATHDATIEDLDYKQNGDLLAMICQSEFGRIRLRYGWSADDVCSLMTAGRKAIGQKIEFSCQLSVGRKRHIRGARFERIRA